jgi:hypothetical protein
MSAEHGELGGFMVLIVGGGGRLEAHEGTS